MEKNLFEIMKFLIEYDTGMVYGDTGSGKSQLAMALIRHAIEAGAKVAVCDTEGNYSGTARRWLSEHTEYEHTTDFDKVLGWAKALPTTLDLVVLDSLGAPVLGAFALANQRTRGDMLLQAAALAYSLKKFSQENDAMTFITNQPVSEMGKPRDFKTGALLNDLQPFGGKANFFIKEVLKAEKSKSKDQLMSEFTFTVHKSRHMPTGYKLLSMKVSNAGIKFSFSPYSGTKGQDELPPITVSAPDPPTSEKGKKEKGKEKEELEQPPEKQDQPETKDGEKKEEKEAESTQESPVNIDGLRDDLEALMKRLKIDSEAFAALASGAGLGKDKTPADLKDVDSINQMIELVQEAKASKGNGQAEPAGFFDKDQQGEDDVL